MLQHQECWAWSLSYTHSTQQLLLLLLSQSLGEKLQKSFINLKYLVWVLRRAGDMLIHSEKWKALKSQVVVRIWTSLPPPHPCDPNSYISFPSKPLPTLRAIPRRFSELDSKSRHPSPRPNFSGKHFSLWRIPDIALRLGWERRGGVGSLQTNITHGKLANRSRVPRRNRYSLLLLALSSKMASLASKFPLVPKSPPPTSLPRPYCAACLSRYDWIGPDG